MKWFGDIMTKRLFSALVAVVTVSFFSSALAETHLISQKDRRFRPNQIKIKVGDEVVFSNDDPIKHNVFSKSAVKRFDFTFFKKDERFTVKFDKPGLVPVWCSIHPTMQLQILVED